MEIINFYSILDEDAADLFDTDNVVVCQYDKVIELIFCLKDPVLYYFFNFFTNQITRSRNKWKFYLKDGIMNIGGKDYVFQKSNGDAEW